MSERFVRLKDSSIAVCLDTSETDAKYRHVLTKDGKRGMTKSGGGSMYCPPADEGVWDATFKLDESDVDYELRFQPCEYAKSDKGEFVAICGIPANCGSADYTMNNIQPNGMRSSSYTISDPCLTRISREEFEAEEERCKAEYKAQQDAESKT